MICELVQYIENEIIPRYNGFDRSHSVSHAEDVIGRSLELAKSYDVNIDMVYAVAAFHDTGLVAGREFHHIESGKIVREDKNLKRWFSEEQIEIMAEAVEDHRASSGEPPRSIYGKIVSQADRLIVPEIVFTRTVQYGLSHYPEKDKEEQYQRFLSHLLEKYARGGYLKLWLPEGESAENLEKIRDIIEDRDALRAIFESIYAEQYVADTPI